MAVFPTPSTELTIPAFSSESRTRLSAPVTCGTCGCRLDQADSTNGAAVWRHFGGDAGRDARGCSVVCATADHDARGDTI